MAPVDATADAVEVAADLLGELATRDAPLAPFCTYRVGGAASLLVEADSVADLELVRDAVEASGCQTLVVGKGSNLLVAERGFPGIVVHLGDAFNEVMIGPPEDTEGDEDDRNGAVVPVTVGASTLLPVAARKTAAAGLTWFEWAVGVPGSVGGAVRMNAGGHGSDMAASLRRVSVFDLRTGGPEDWPAERLDLGYRRSALGSHHVVLYAELLLEPGDATAATEEISEIVRWRRANQPGGQNAGSVFTNPAGQSAGRLIDELGLKGLRVGTAEVSTKHANFIQADPGGSADDVHALIREVRLRVAAATGIELEVENRLIGFGDRDDGGSGSDR
ncbi:MAG: UDP-N-acetylmuramate dehydrogenase [Actinomycetota bacterium]